MEERHLVEMRLSRIVLHEDSERQYIFVSECNGEREFPIVIGTPEALEIHRVVSGTRSERPLTHQLAHSIVERMGGRVESCDIVALRQNTFFAELQIEVEGRGRVAVDARPSDAIAVCLRAGGKIHVDEAVLRQVQGEPPPEMPANGESDP